MTVLHDFYEDRTEPLVASEFRRTPSGAIGRDVYISEEALIRFFEIEPDYLRRMKNGYWPYVEKNDGFVTFWGRYSPGGCRITIIDNSHQARFRFMQQEVERICAQWAENVKEATVGFTNFARALSGS